MGAFEVVGVFVAAVAIGIGVHDAYLHYGPHHMARHRSTGHATGPAAARGGWGGGGAGIPVVVGGVEKRPVNPADAQA